MATGVTRSIGKVAHQMQDFQLDKHQKSLAAGLRPDPLGELERSPRPPSRTKGVYF